ncbi:MAG TPA: hypothetical protein VNK04_26375 [Gemmataceae bacterium]|nr:hypothetical protein [Gemmataceae bacterium]
MQVFTPCRRGWILLAVLLGVSWGCGSRDRPVPVRGKVTVDGAPIAGAGVVFHPKDGNGRPASGETRADGTYHLTTFTEGDGALPGEYRVTIVWEEPVHPYLAYRDGSPKKKALEKEYLEWKAKHKPKPSPIPPHYGDPAKTPLEQKVPVPGGVADFALQSNAP